MHPHRLRAARALGVSGQADQDAAATRLLGVNPTSLVSGVLDPVAQGSWRDRFMAWCVLGNRP
jgi:hypothetical protein